MTWVAVSAVLAVDLCMTVLLGSVVGAALKRRLGHG